MSVYVGRDGVRKERETERERERERESKRDEIEKKNDHVKVQRT
jgi:hypothetical protein